jgi:hypothetical protein
VVLPRTRLVVQNANRKDQLFNRQVVAAGRGAARDRERHARRTSGDLKRPYCHGLSGERNHAGRQEALVQLERSTAQLFHTASRANRIDCVLGTGTGGSMKRFAVVTSILACVCVMPMVRAQSPRTRVAGRGSAGTLSIDRPNRVSTETITLTFGADAGASTFTVDFTARLTLDPTAPPPDVVDITVTQYPAEDKNPEMSLHIDGQALPLNARLHTRRSIVATAAFSEFLRMTTAAAITEDAFGSELEFSSAQLGMLRAAADRWARRR